MKRESVNLTVNYVMLAIIVWLIGTGLLIRLRLPRGSGSALSLWGMGRHDWGEIHFWLALTFVGIVVIHLIMHWTWIKYVVAEYFRSKKLQSLIGSILLFVLIITACLLFIIPLESREDGGRHGFGHGRSINE